MPRTTSQTIDSHVSDLLALEEHFAEALATQIRALPDRHAEVVGELGRHQRTVQDHIQALRKVRSVGNPWAGGVIAGAIKRAAAVAAGLEAGGIDLLRMEKLPRDLRDNYAAASLATIGYTMLYTTAVALADDLVALLSARHLKDYSRMTIAICSLMPGAVLDFLRESGVPAREEALPGIRQALETVWEGAAKGALQPA